LESLEVQKLVQKKVGEAIARFKMIREGDRVAVGVSGGKDSVTLLETLLQLRKKAPINFEIFAFTIEQGKFLAPIQPYGEWLTQRGIAWHYVQDGPSLRLLEEDPGHGCDKCSRFRRRAVYDVGKHLGANVIALGHTADDFCESFLRNAMFTGALSSLPPVTYSREKDFRLIRPLVYVQEAWTTAYASELGCPVIACGCSQKTGTVRRGIREFFAELEQDYPNLKDTLIGAMGNIRVQRLLDQRYFDPDTGDEPTEPEQFPILQN
jgi:tRNA 2-thiocytidine biosynthesis protein TtcA